MKPAKKIENILFDEDRLVIKKNDKPIIKPKNIIIKSNIEFGFIEEISLIDEKKINPKKKEKRGTL